MTAPLEDADDTARLILMDYEGKEYPAFSIGRFAMLLEKEHPWVTLSDVKYFWSKYQGFDHTPSHSYKTGRRI